MHITAFPNGTGHLSALWRTKRVVHMEGDYVQFQQKAALRQANMLWSKGFDLNVPVSCQTILPALGQDSAG